MVKIKALGSTLLSFVLLLLALAGTAYLSFFSAYIPSGSGTLNGLPFDYGLTATFGYFINVWRPSQFPHALAFVSLILLLIAVFALLIFLIMAIAKKKAFLILPALLFAVELASLSFVLVLVIPMVQMRVLGAIATVGMAGVVGFILFALLFTVAPLTPLIKCLFYGVKKMAGVNQPCCQSAATQPVDVEAVRALIKAELAARLAEKSLEQLSPEVEKPAAEVASLEEKIDTPVAKKEEPVLELAPNQEPEIIVLPNLDEEVKVDKVACECQKEEKGFKHSVIRALKALLSTFISAVLLAAATGITLYLAYFSDFIPSGTGNINGQAFNYGLDASIGYLLNVWRPSQFPHALSFISLILLLIAAVLTLVLIVAAAVKLKFVLILPALLFGGSIGALTFIMILVIPMVEMRVIGAIPTVGMAGAFGLTLFALVFAFAPLIPLFKCLLLGIQKFAGVEKSCCSNPLSVKNFDEDTVRALVEEELAYLAPKECVCEEKCCECKEKSSVESVVTPVVAYESAPEVKEEPVAQEVKTEPAIVIEPSVVEELEEKAEEDEEDENDGEEDDVTESDDASLPESLIGIVGKGKRRKPSFETRVKNSDFDIRHKYYDLRDYLVWYGLKNRLSKPGDTFSYQRQRFAYITIVGKHIRLYVGLDPNEFTNSTIPVEKIDAKKYADVPCMLRIKSDLSYRRAKKLVDELAAKIGLPTPTSEPPLETQEQKEEVE